MSAPQFYGLFVGIDSYLPPVPPLDGCVNDMRAMKDYITRNVAPENLHLEVLENDQATRMNVVEKFESHLSQAGENDIAFFYYSGHGSQEPAHEMFWHLEPDKKNETIVCYDSRSADGSDLADKELATLIDLVSANKPHFLVVMDCCNSGDGTREIAAGKTRQSPGSKKTRSLDSYILPRNLNSDRSVLSTSGVEKLEIPTPRHVLLSAAHSFQLAKETYLGGSPRGVFTFSLIEVLEASVGPVTYSDLMRRVRRLVTQRTYEQTPQLYSLDIDDSDQNFLGGSTARKANYYALSYDREDNEWSIDAGAVHGIMEGNAGEETLLAVYAEDANETELEDFNRSLGQVSVKSISAEQSNVRLEGDLWLDKETQYRAVVYSMPIQAMSACFVGDEGEGLPLLIKALESNMEASVYLSMTDKKQEADYLLHINNGQYVVTRGSDGVDQPLIKQLRGYTKEHAKKAIENLVHIARWERTLELKNPGSSLSSQAVKVSIYEADEDKEIMPGSNGYSFSYKESEGKSARPKFRVKLNNNSGQKLYVSLLYMSSSFEINPGVLPAGGIWLESGEEAWALNGRAITASVSEAHFNLGRSEVQETFKLIMSTTEVNAKLMRMKELDDPEPMTRAISKGKANTRSLMFDDEEETGSLDDWNTDEYGILVKRLD